MHGEFRSWVDVSPASTERVTTVAGWVYALEGKIDGVRARAREYKWDGEYGFPRPDVGVAFSAVEQAMRCGFRIDLPWLLGTDEELTLEAHLDGEWRSFVQFGIQTAPPLPWYAYAFARLRSRVRRKRKGRDSYEGFERGYVCWIDQPADWKTTHRQFVVSGWCFNRKGGGLDGVRAWVAQKCYTGRLRLPRPDVAASLGSRPDIANSGFEVAVENHAVYPTTFRLEVSHTDGIWREVFRKNLGRGRKGGSSKDVASLGYPEWIKRYDSLSSSDRRAIASHIESFKHSPEFSVVITLEDTEQGHLREAIRSLRQQLYPHWKLYFRSRNSNEDAVAQKLERFARSDHRITAQMNVPIKSKGDGFVLFLGECDRLAPAALYDAAVALEGNPHLRVIYSDEDQLDEQGRRERPFFKPEWNETLFRESNYLGGLCLLRNEQRWPEPGSEVEPFELLLAQIKAAAAGEIGHLPRILYHRRGKSRKEGKHETCLIETDLEERGIAAQVFPVAETDLRRVRYLIRRPVPPVSVIIPTRDYVQLLRPCLDSLLHSTSYQHFEVVIVDNGTTEADALAYLESVAHDPRVRILPKNEEFNYSRLNNLAVSQCESDFVVLLNNDIVVIQPEWLEELVSQGLREGVGAVGPRLLYPDGYIQQAGVILGAGQHGVAEVAHRGLGGQYVGYAGRAALAQELSSVGAACMLVRRSAYLEVGGFDEQHLKVAFNDIDFCLKLRQRGYKIVYTPHTSLYHLEHASRGWENTTSKRERFMEEIRYMKEKWGNLLVTDPAYSPNLSLGEDLFELAFPPRVSKPWV